MAYEREEDQLTQEEWYELKVGDMLIVNDHMTKDIWYAEGMRAGFPIPGDTCMIYKRSNIPGVYTLEFLTGPRLTCKEFSPCHIFGNHTPHPWNYFDIGNKTST